MKEKLIKKRKELLVGFIIILIVIGITIWFKNYDTYALSHINTLAVLDYDTTDYVYLSDLEYDEEKSYVEPGYYIRKDKNNSSGLISLNIKESDKSTKKYFIKGMSAWATSELYYDLTDLKYDYFRAYVGVDSTQTSTYYNSGVTISIFTSKDGKVWDEQVKTGTLKGWDDAVYVNVPLKDAKYLKLYAYENGDSWYSQWHDDVVYANAKLVKEGYEENLTTNDLVRPLSYYDTLLKDYDNGKINNDIDYDLLLLQRDFVSNVGYDILQAYLNYSPSYVNTIKWLMEDKKILELFILGGAPDGNYGTALQVFTSLYNTYKTDLEGPNSDLYLKMMVSLSLTHSASVGLWVSGAPEDPNDPNGSNALNRYKIYKELYLAGFLDNNIFEDLTVEEMRYVMNNIIDDEEIVWLNNLSRSEQSRDPYHYINYTFDYNYANEIYYQNNNTYNKDYWSNHIRAKSNNFKTPYNLNEYNITYGSLKHPKLWIVFEEGSVCGGLSKTGSNINGVFGIPSSVVSQPGHAAYVYMSKDSNGNKLWNLYNDVSGWGQSGKTEKLSTRMPNGWGDGSYVGAYPASYILLAQKALDDYENYAKSEKILMKANMYLSDPQKLESLYEEALTIQKVNFDAWLGLVNLYVDTNKSEKELLALVERITNDLTYYPLPMHDLLRIIEPSLSAENHIAFQKYLMDALNKAKNATASETLQYQAVKQVANYLANSHDTTIATFSFDGEDAGKIKLAKRYEGNGVKWQYSLDSGESWLDASDMSVELTAEQLSHITAETNILVRVVGALEVVYSIDITESLIPPTIYANDLENRIIGADNNIEWRYANENTWNSLQTTEPNLKGNVDIYIRVKSHGTSLASQELLLKFTDVGEENTKRYIPQSRMHIVDYSSDEPGHNNGIDNLLDGNINTHWHTLWNGTDTEKFVVIKLDRASYIKAIDYVPRFGAGNGTILSAKVSVSKDDASYESDNWTVITESTTWANNSDIKTINYSEEEIYAQYIKIEGISTVGNYMSAAAFHVYEDLTKLDIPVVDITYSNTSLTNEPVKATLVLENGENIRDALTITNETTEEDPYTHTFTENGEYTFHYLDKYGLTGSITARVDWIDTTIPTASIEYSTTKPTDQDVVAKLVNPSKSITILNNNGSNTYTFTKNGSFTFRYQDKYGNIGTTTATVNNINKKDAKVTLEYSTKNYTNKDVTVTIKSNDVISVLNGKNSYTFTQNGKYEFIYEDINGNVNSLIAEVTWIDKTPPVGQIGYTPSTKTSGPVKAILTGNEDIFIKNNNGNNIYTFKENGTFEFIFADKAGNISRTTAKVDWIEPVENTENTSNPTTENKPNSSNGSNNFNNNSNELPNNKEPIEEDKNDPNSSTSNKEIKEKTSNMKKIISIGAGIIIISGGIVGIVYMFKLMKQKRK